MRYAKLKWNGSDAVLEFEHILMYISYEFIHSSKQTHTFHAKFKGSLTTNGDCISVLIIYTFNFYKCSDGNLC